MCYKDLTVKSCLAQLCKKKYIYHKFHNKTHSVRYQGLTVLYYLVHLRVICIKYVEKCAFIYNLKSVVFHIDLIVVKEQHEYDTEKSITNK